MIEVVKERRRTKKIYIVDCYHCGSTLRFDRYDIGNFSGLYQYESFVGIQCPVCKTSMSSRNVDEFMSDFGVKVKEHEEV